MKLLSRSECIIAASTILLAGCGGGASAPGQSATGLSAPAAMKMSASAVSSASSTTSNADPSAFFNYTRPATYGVASTSGVRVPMRDGSYLACQIFRPAGPDGQPAPGRFPGILFDFTGYHVTGSSAAQANAAPYASRGYHVSVCDVRGSGDSPGEYEPLSPQEQLDNYDLIEWMAAQPWSDGNIGQTGTSYGGHTSILAAANRPPHLRTIIPHNNLTDWYSDTVYHGGIMSGSIAYLYALAPVLASGGSNILGPVTMPKNTAAVYAQHPFFDDYWAARGVSTRYDTLTIPILQLAGWNDRYKVGQLLNQQNRPQNVWTVLGPWGHGSTTGPDGRSSMDITNVRLAWFDRHLKGMDTPMPPDRVTSMEQPVERSTGWKSFAQWPIRAATPMRLYFTVDKKLASTPGVLAGDNSFVVNANDSGADPATDIKPPVDQKLADASPYRAVFDTSPLSADAVIAGTVEAVVNARFSAPDGNIIVRLSEVAPDGTPRQIAVGWLKASRYKGLDHAESIVPGQTYPIKVSLRPTHWRLPAGHALRLSVSSGDLPDAIGDAPPGTVTIVSGGPAASYADIPLIEGASIRALGSGWVADSEGKKISFTMDVRQSDTGPSGEFHLRDARANARVEISQVLSVTGASEACGRTRAPRGSVEITGRGTFNGQVGTFRVCAVDAAEPGRDSLAVACTSGCTYDSRSRSSDDALGAGNISVNASSAFSDPAEASSAPAAVILEPLPTRSLIAGTSNALRVRVLDASGSAVPNVPLTLVGPLGTLATLPSGASGLVEFTVIPALGSELWVTTGTLSSNVAAVFP